jgi:uncharacterized membrane protein YphA (DoxX/SURF4 family)
VKDRLAAAQPWLSTLARLFLAGVFILSGWPKLLDSEGTVRSVRAFQLVPEFAVRSFAYGLPLLELILALLLALGLATRVAALVTAGLMVMFMFGIAMAWARGLDINCGCFGNTGATVVNPVAGYVKDLLRDTGFLVAAALLIRWPFSRLSLDGMLGLTQPAAATPTAA